MNQYITGATIKKLREKANLTQNQLAEKLFVSDKAISKWETGRGFPDISMIENLAKTLGVSVIELLSGEEIVNSNKNANIRRSKIYVCPICQNVIFSVGQALVSCCGITLPSLEAETDETKNLEHKIQMEKCEDEFFIHIDHEMSKNHYISFFLALSDDGIELKKLYPEQNAEARFKINRVKKIYAYCNRDGFFEVKI